MEAAVPKQYLMLGEHCVLEHTLRCLHRHSAVTGVVVAVAANDEQFANIASAKHVQRVDGGAQRADSVLSALSRLLEQGCADDWAMVHDAVRPCLHSDDVDRLVAHATSSDMSAQGAILALAVRDTMKRVSANRITATVARDDLWHALTPQLFRVRALHDALHSARENNVQVTDEAQAMELAGASVAVVAGRPDNIKITRPDDLQLAAMYLQGAMGT